MAAAIWLQDGFTATELQQLAQSRRDAKHVCLLRALAVTYYGGSRSEVERIGGAGPQTVRYWVLQFNSDGPDDLVAGKAPWGRPRLDANQLAFLATGRSCAVGPLRVPVSISTQALSR